MKRKRARIRVLLIGENVDLCLFAALREQGYETAVSGSSDDTELLVSSFRPHLIIVHVRHQNRIDMATLRKCRAAARGAPVLAAVSVPGHETTLRALEEGATSFLSLPIEGAKVKRIVGGLVAGRGRT
ncbi:MAG TPA: hypothetical protein VNN77_11335 [candidate division Zixibacteria bacterium]|nr:hypothetical protein [candidate division Zixibacteria bacterium]